MAKFKNSIYDEVPEEFTDCKIKLTKDMFQVWSRYAMRHTYHLNSDASRLAFIEWYLTGEMANRRLSITVSNPDVLKPLLQPVMAAGAMNVLLLEVWRKRYSHDTSFNIYTSSGYLKFAADICHQNFSSILKDFMPNSLIRAVQASASRRSGSSLSYGLHHIADSIDIYRAKYQNLEDWRVREALNFDWTLHHVIKENKPNILANETVEYWSSPVTSYAPRLSRMMAALASLSPRHRDKVDTPAKLVQNADLVADWFVLEVLPLYSDLLIFASPDVRKELTFLSETTEKKSVSDTRRLKLKLDGFPALPGDNQEEIDLLVIGPFGAASGLGTGTRRSVNALSETGCSFRVINCLYDNPSKNTQPISEELVYKGETPKAVLWHFNGEYLPGVMRAYPEFTQSDRNIGYFFWETESMPHAHELSTELLDEIWAPSEFCRTCYDGHGVPVYEVGTSVDLPKIDRYLPRSHFDLDENDFIFMFSFDSHSVIHRKNPAAVVKAFQSAFPVETDVRLIIKTQNFEQAHWGNVNGRNEELLELISHDKRIMFINRTMTLEELYSMKSATDCYVSLHRSEGFGYGPAEAMALGKPTIMTNYSANVEFGRDGASLLVDGPLIHVLEHEYLYWRPEMVWADPSYRIAASYMRDLYEDRTYAIELGMRGQKKVVEEFGRMAMAKKYENRLEELGLLSKGKKLYSGSEFASSLTP